MDPRRCVAWLCRRAPWHDVRAPYASSRSASVRCQRPTVLPLVVDRRQPPRPSLVHFSPGDGLESSAEAIRATAAAGWWGYTGWRSPRTLRRSRSSEVRGGVGAVRPRSLCVFWNDRFAAYPCSPRQLSYPDGCLQSSGTQVMLSRPPCLRPSRNITEPEGWRADLLRKAKLPFTYVVFAKGPGKDEMQAPAPLGRSRHVSVSSPHGEGWLAACSSPGGEAVVTSWAPVFASFLPPTVCHEYSKNHSFSLCTSVPGGRRYRSFTRQVPKGRDPVRIDSACDRGALQRKQGHFSP